MSTEELAAFGLLPSDLAAEEVEVWPENWPSALAFNSMLTQWRMGFSGPIGLDYTALPVVLRLQRIPHKQWSQIFEDVQIMEHEALESMRAT